MSDQLPPVGAKRGHAVRICFGRLAAETGRHRMDSLLGPFWNGSRTAMIVNIPSYSGWVRFGTLFIGGAWIDTDCLSATD